jgi:oxepin-CoA hydrolase / 3-oxo-5,6-dehydrosuberyl-CoA semialdehyde dehydrogenase
MFTQSKRLSYKTDVSFGNNRELDPTENSALMSLLLQSHIAGQWFGTQSSQALQSALNGETVAHTHAEAIDFAQALDFARRVGGPNLLKLDFQQRAERLKALAKYLNEHKEALYTVSAHTGATRVDSWIDIEGGSGTLFAYAGVGVNEMPSGNVLHEGPVMSLGKTGAFAGTHILVPRGGVAVHINAFNFPIWGLLEKFAPCFLAGTPCIGKPATATSYLTHALCKLIEQSGILPAGALQLVIGGTGDLLARLDERDVVTFTGSADTAAKLRTHPNIIARSIPFNAEADSLNCAILAPNIHSEHEEFDLFVKEVAKEMTVKAGQKCTAIRRVIVPRTHVDAVIEKLSARLAKTSVGNPTVEGVRMGALASHAQLADVRARIQELHTCGAEMAFFNANLPILGEGSARGAFHTPALLLHEKPMMNEDVHAIEAFGPVATLMPYDDFDEALALAAKGRGSLVTTLCARDAKTVAYAVPQLAALHGRVHILEAEAAKESTGHGSPLPMLKHGGPGRAGGGEELGGIRAVKHYLQRAAVQGSPSMLAAVTGEYARGAARIETDVHPFRRYFDELQIGESLLTKPRTVTVADIEQFAHLSGDHFYMHMDEEAAKQSPFGQRIAHGYFVLSAAAGLFVAPEPGPVLANYGLDTLRFTKPVAIGDTIQARLTAKRKIDRNKKDANGQGQGVVAWDVEVTNQNNEIVASYDILTLVSKRLAG